MGPAGLAVGRRAIGNENLHWSERAKLANPSGLPPVFAPPTPPPRKWRKGYGLAGIAILVAAVITAAVVVMLPGGENTARLPTVTSATSLSTKSLSQTSTTVTTAPANPTGSTTPAVDPDGFLSFTDKERDFTLEYPASWKNTDLGRLGDREQIDEDVVGFADQDGPQEGGLFFDFVEVAVGEDPLYTESMLPSFPEAMLRSLERARDTYEDVKVLEQIHSVRVGGAPGSAMTISLSTEGHTIVVSSYILLGDHRIYELELSADEEDLQECTPLFERILRGFRCGPSLPVV
jgi:hypothetical protein